MSIEQATFAAGCFWGIQDVFDNQPGVVKTTVGYTGGHIENPDYKAVCNGQSGHAEAVLVEFDTDLISYENLLETFWHCHNPASKNSQGADVGEQYRSAIFCHDENQLHKAVGSKIKQPNSKNIVTEITLAGKFYPAEDYHQHYNQKNGKVCGVKGLDD